MKRFVFLVLCGMALQCLPTSPAAAEVSVVRSPYQPGKTYAGPNPVNSVYYRNPGNPQWRMAFSRELSGLSCRPALAGFSTSGTWQGHLNPDGTCADPAEPVEWATGNRLNYEGVVGKIGK